MTYSGSPNPDPGIVKRDEETLQRQREEKAEQDRLEEERRILEQEVPFWRRQKQLEDGEFTQDPEGPHYQSIAAETGIGIATDFATVGLLGIPVFGQALYYGTNFGVGYGANALAQWMRGDWDNFSHGEALAAGGFQTIPMGTTAKGLKGLRRAAVKGAAGGAGMAQLEVGIDERRRLTGQELMLSTILGGTVAGGFKSAELGGDLVSDVIRNPYQLAPEGSLARMLGDTGGGVVPPPIDPIPRSAKRRSLYGETFKRARTSITEPELIDLENELVLNWGMKDRTFDWNQYKARTANKGKSSAAKRKLGAMFESVTYTKVDYEKIAAQRMPELRKFYGPILKDIGLKPGDFQLHHQKPILASLPGYDGLRFGSDEWWDVTEVLYKNGLRAGDHERNLKPLVGGSKPSRKNVKNKKVLDTQGKFETPHSVTHKYLDIKVGDDGTLFWTKDVRDRMNGVGEWEGKGPDHQFRLDKWNEYAQIINKSIDITNQAEQTFIDLYRRDPKLFLIPTDPSELDLIIERLVKLEDDGLLNPKKLKGSWQVNQMETIVSEVTEELQKSQGDYNFRAVFGRDGLMQRFVNKREITDKELRLLKDLPLGEQLEALQKYTGMTIEDINLLIDTRPNFDPIRFIKEHR